VQDKSEWGPRALGHRSILASPKSIEMKEKVNKKIKFREGFRPFAPSVVYEKAEKYFDIGKYKDQDPFRFMLYVVPVNKEYQKDLGAITHVDGTARPQFVYKDVNPLYHNLIKEVGKESNIPVVLNTSFNLKGEPIVNNTKNAINTFYKSGLDYLVVGKFVIKK
jgi:carbamoyltransferase